MDSYPNSAARRMSSSGWLPPRRKEKQERAWSSVNMGGGYWLSDSIDSFEFPCVGWVVGKTEEGVGFAELDVPFDVLPALGGGPPMAGEREGAAGLGDGALVRSGEESQGVEVTSARFGGDMDFDGGTVAVQGESGGG